MSGSLLDRLPDEAEIPYPPRDRVELDVLSDASGVGSAQDGMEHLFERHFVIFRYPAVGATHDTCMIFDEDVFCTDLAAETPEVPKLGEAGIHRLCHGVPEYAECIWSAHLR